jgi:hypothetical protein
MLNFYQKRRSAHSLVRFVPLIVISFGVYTIGSAKKFIGWMNGALIITLLTMSFQPIKVAMINPVNSLRPSKRI